MTTLTHLGPDGRPRMVDVGDKAATTRIAVASGCLTVGPDTLKTVREGAAKGDVVGVATLAGIMGAKKTADLIPLCHPLALSRVDVSIEIDEDLPGLMVRATVRTEGRTGVEMEALTAVTTACLTLYDMLKAVDRTMQIGDIRVESKTGGASGDWTAERS